MPLKQSMGFRKRRRKEHVYQTCLAIAKSDMDRDTGHASQAFQTVRLGKLAWVAVMKGLIGRGGGFLTTTSRTVRCLPQADCGWHRLVDESGYLRDARCSSTVLIERSRYSEADLVDKRTVDCGEGIPLLTGGPVSLARTKCALAMRMMIPSTLYKLSRSLEHSSVKH